MAIRDNDVNLRGTERGSVAGLFSDYSKAQQAISDLKAAGFSDNQIGVARADQGDIGASDTSTSSGVSSSQRLGGEHHDRGMWDKIKSAFGGDDESDDIRDRSAVRDDVTNSTGAAYSDADYAYGEDFPRHLSSAGLNENESSYFSSRLHQGGCLVTVNTLGGRAADAIAILERNGADIGSGAVDFGRQRQGLARDVESGVGERRIQLLGEMLRVHKERVARGEVRVRKEVVSENRTVQVPVTREELVIERTDVSGEVPTNARIGEDKEIRIPLTEEQVRVEKQPVVTGEVRVGKKQVQDTRNVSDTVRREEVKVDREGDVNVDESDLNRDRKKKIA
jgi:uncharacterized protein (TIGR02271 family)